MSFMPDFSRRGFIRLAAAAPLLGQLAAKNVLASAASALGKDSRQNVYTRLGVKTIINCRGTWTYLSGSLEFPEVRAAPWRPLPLRAWPAAIQNISGSFPTLRD